MRKTESWRRRGQLHSQVQAVQIESPENARSRGQFESRDKSGAIATLKEAAEDVSELTAIHDRGSALFIIGTSYFEMGDNAEAKRILDEARRAAASDLREVAYPSFCITYAFERLGDTRAILEIAPDPPPGMVPVFKW